MLIRIRIFLRIVSLLFSTVVLKKSHGLFYKTCELCDGVTHTKLQSDHSNGVYTAKFKCKKCGAVGDLKEEWKIGV